MYFREVLKNETTPESLNAWLDGLSFLATHFVNLAEEFKSKIIFTLDY